MVCLIFASIGRYVLSFPSVTAVLQYMPPLPPSPRPRIFLEARRWHCLVSHLLPDDVQLETAGLVSREIQEEDGECCSAAIATGGDQLSAAVTTSPLQRGWHEARAPLPPHAFSPLFLSSCATASQAPGLDRSAPPFSLG